MSIPFTKEVLLGGSIYSIDEYGRFTCLRCGAHYKRKEHLHRHMKHECQYTEGVVKYQCNACGRLFTQKHSLQRHEKYKVCFKNKEEQAIAVPLM